MKKMFTLAALGAAVAVLSGCTSVESTQKFNGINLADRSDKAVCQTLVEIPYFYLWGIPIAGGSAAGDGKMSMFCNNVNVEDAIYLLTNEVRGKGAARLINTQVFVSDSQVFPGLISKRCIQASGTGVRNRSEAMSRAAENFDAEASAF